jgi:hypothetical protein
VVLGVTRIPLARTVSLFRGGVVIAAVARLARPVLPGDLVAAFAWLARWDRLRLLEGQRGSGEND